MQGNCFTTTPASTNYYLNLQFKKCLTNYTIKNFTVFFYFKQNYDDSFIYIGKPGMSEA